MFQSVLPVADFTKTTATLIYRGDTYEVPQQRVDRPKRTPEEVAALTGKELIYRGDRYKCASASLPVAAKKAGKQLNYRGEIYQL